jgi:hypothetical protein
MKSSDMAGHIIIDWASYRMFLFPPSATDPINPEQAGQDSQNARHLAKDFIIFSHASH